MAKVRFEMDGVRYGGTFVANRERGLQFFVDATRTPPDAVAELERRELAGSFGRSNISIPIPLMANESLMNVGFLTAAYLLWFREFGYSWALQEHLDEVRRQIRNPDNAIITGKYAVRCRDAFFSQPWVGIVRHQGEIILVAAIADKLVSLPPLDRPDVPFTDLSEPEGTFTADYRKLHFYEDHRFGGPLALAFGDRFLIMPDVLLKRTAEGAVLMYPSWTSEARIMHFISAEEHERLSKLRNVKIIHAKYQLLIPRRETGRSESKDEA